MGVQRASFQFDDEETHYFEEMRLVREKKSGWECFQVND